MSHRAQPVGHVLLPLFVFGAVSLLLGTATEVMGVFNGATEALRGWWRSGGLEIQGEMGLPGPVGLLITGLASFALAGAILGTPGGGRRVVLGLSAFLLSLGLIPAFAVWGIFWKPFGMLLAVIWSWFSAVVYAGRHGMPCEFEGGSEAGNVILLEGERVEIESRNRANGES